jgi:hypothetical protein
MCPCPKSPTRGLVDEPCDYVVIVCDDPLLLFSAVAPAERNRNRRNQWANHVPGAPEDLPPLKSRNHIGDTRQTLRAPWAVRAEVGKIRFRLWRAIRILGHTFDNRTPALARHGMRLDSKPIAAHDRNLLSRLTGRAPVHTLEAAAGRVIRFVSNG